MQFLNRFIAWCPCVTFACASCCSVAFKSAESCLEDLDESRSRQLKGLLSEYFDKRRDQGVALAAVDIEELDKYKVKRTRWLSGVNSLNSVLNDVVYLCVCVFLQLTDWENQIRADIRSFLSYRSDEKFSGRAVARILHGIGEGTRRSQYVCVRAKQA